MTNILTNHVQQVDIENVGSRVVHGCRLYSFKKEQVHVVNPYDGIGRTFECFRCHRDLPEDQFGPVGEVNRSRKMLLILHPLCWTCRKQAQGKWTKHNLYSTALDRYWNKNITCARQGAKARGILFGIEKDDALGLYLEQNEYCAITGLKMDWRPKYGRAKGERNHSAPSIDRIDSSGNYVLGNIQIVLQVVNTMKGELPMDVFVEMCRRIADRNLSL